MPVCVSKKPMETKGVAFRKINRKCGLLLNCGATLTFTLLQTSLSLKSGKRQFEKLYKFSSVPIGEEIQRYLLSWNMRK